MRKTSKFLACAAMCGYTITAGMVLFLVLFAVQLDYYTKKTFLLPNLALFGIGLLFVIGFALLFLKTQTRCEAFLARYSTVALGGILLALLAFLFYVATQVIFALDWDIAIVNFTAQQIAQGVNPMDDWINYYFSQCSNNIFLTWMYGQVLKINLSTHLFSPEQAGILLVWLQMAISVLVSVLLYHIVLRYTHKYLIAWGTWLAYIILLGTSFWVFAPYSDATGLLFPVLFIWLYQTANQTQSRLWKTVLWLIMVSCSYLAYHIKPSGVIVFLAILIAEFVVFLQDILPFQRQTLKTIAWAGTIAASACVIFGCANFAYQNVIMPNSGIILNQEAELGVAHYFMIGLNKESDGTYNAEDQVFSNSFETNAARTSANLQRAFERIQDFGPTGLITHLAKKCRMAFGDATFTWGLESEFSMAEYQPNEAAITTFCRQLSKVNSTGYSYLAMGYQIIWLAALGGMLGLGLLYRSQPSADRPFLLMLAVSLIGMLCYLLLFEVRARYVYLFVPIYLLAATLGWCGIVRFVRQHQKPLTKM